MPTLLASSHDVCALLLPGSSELRKLKHCYFFYSKDDVRFGPRYVT